MREPHTRSDPSIRLGGRGHGIPEHASQIRTATHPSERHEAQESEGTTAQGLHEFSEQLRIQSILRMLEMNARGEFNAFERIELYAALNNQRTRKALGITVESSPCKQNRQRINTQ
jgi:hypothetical protein